MCFVCVFFNNSVSIYINQNVMALPVNGGRARAIPSGPEYWTNPCNYPWDLNVPPLPDAVYANSFQLRLNQDLVYVKNWMGRFVSKKDILIEFLEYFIHFFPI